jgi:hypothetical protein
VKLKGALESKFSSKIFSRLKIKNEHMEQSVLLKKLKIHFCTDFCKTFFQIIEKTRNSQAFSETP